MVNVVLKIPDDLSWITTNKEGLKWVEASLINKLSEIKIGDLLAQKSELKEEEINELDHIIKHALYSKIKAQE